MGLTLPCVRILGADSGAGIDAVKIQNWSVPLMSFPARFAGKCSKCSAPIHIGQFITWSRRESGSASHANCTLPDAPPTPTAIKLGMPEVQAMIDAAVTAAKLSGFERAIDRKSVV